MSLQYDRSKVSANQERFVKKNNYSKDVIVAKLLLRGYTFNKKRPSFIFLPSALSLFLFVTNNSPNSQIKFSVLRYPIVQGPSYSIRNESMFSKQVEIRARIPMVQNRVICNHSTFLDHNDGRLEKTWR